MPQRTSQVSAGRKPIQTKDIDGFTRSVDAFTRMIDRLQSEYAELETRHAELNTELAAVNDRLHEAAEANRRLAAYRDRVVGAVTVGIIAVDADGIIRLFNPSAAKLLGLKAEHVVTRPYATVWPALADDSATALACARGAAPVRDHRREVTDCSGADLVLSVSTVPLGASARDGALEVFSDLTPVERMNTEIARLRTLAALGEMSATIAHEIRNPLGGIIGFAELLARHHPGDSKHQEMVGKIVTGAQNLNSLVGRLLDFAREPKLSLRPLEWRHFLETTLDQYEDNTRRQGGRITLVRRWPEKLPSGQADSICLRQAIWNILENAQHAAGDNGSIEFESDIRGDGALTVRITDNGSGIDAKTLDRVFSPFMTTKKKGTGLGLATARKFIEAHGGTVTIESTVGTGTTVSLVLPQNTEEG